MRQKSGTQLDLAFVAKAFATPTRELRGMVRGTDKIESQAAAARAKAHTTAIQRTILSIIASEGALTAKELEGRIEFRGLGPSSVRKRVSELRQAGKLIQAVDSAGAPLRREGCAVMEIV